MEFPSSGFSLTCGHRRAVHLAYAGHLHLLNRTVTALTKRPSRCSAGRARVPSANALACTTGQTRTGTGRKDRATPASRPAPVRPDSRVAGSSPAGTPCGPRARRPCRCAAACTPAAPGTPQVAGLDRPRLLAGRIVEARLEVAGERYAGDGDLPDREALSVSKMPGAVETLPGELCPLSISSRIRPPIP